MALRSGFCYYGVYRMRTIELNNKKYRIRDITVLEGMYLAWPLLDGASKGMTPIEAYMLMGKEFLMEIEKVALSFVDRVKSEDHFYPVVDERGFVKDPELTVYETTMLFMEVIKDLQDSFTKAASGLEKPQN